MKKVKRYKQGDVVDVSPDDSGGGGGGAGVSQSGGSFFDQPTPERPTATAADVRNASNLYYNDNNEIRSGLRNPGPYMAANRLETQGVDIPGLIGNRPGVGMDMGETIPNPNARTWRRPLPGMAKGGAVKKMAKGGAVSKASSASKRADGCAQRGKTKGRFV
jgi:hypothetical protein